MSKDSKNHHVFKLEVTINTSLINSSTEDLTFKNFYLSGVIYFPRLTSVTQFPSFTVTSEANPSTIDVIVPSPTASE